MSRRAALSFAGVALACALIFGGLAFAFANRAASSARDALITNALAACAGESARDVALERVSAQGGYALIGGARDALPADINPLSRPEILSAQETGQGEAARDAGAGYVRVSRAVRAENGDVLCFTYVKVNFAGDILRALPHLLPVLAPMALACVWFAIRCARRVAAPVNALDLGKPALHTLGREYKPFAEKLKAQNQRLESYGNALTERQAEFDAITRDMSEPMVVVNRAGEALTMNRAAMKLFGVKEYAGKPLCALAPELPLCADERTGLLRLSARAEAIERGGRCYQLFANPVIDERGNANGVMLLMTDVTERRRAELSRREFTANVSHELKTPLTAILGYAEIMKNGIAPEEMLREFAGRIHFEATRLIKLVEDILHLSRLDEVSDAQRESVGMLSMAREIAKRLAPQAEARGIRMRAEGDDIKIKGDAQMLEELLYNLMDNAIKYNAPNGEVCVRAKETPKEDWIEVRDTGIGIDPAYHERIFERFFRVDKSRSKQIGGTGLGLSIVKHAAMHHHASVLVDSAPGRGTRIRVSFPKA